MLGLLLCPAAATVTNLICTRGGQHHDWTADYRLYSKDRVDETVLFGHARDALIERLPAGAPLLVGIDDTIVRKTGKKIHGSGWKRDPLGPAFQTNLVHAQRYLQLSAAWPLEGGQARMVPIDFQHAPSPAKPGKAATDVDQQAYREALKQQNLNRVALDRITALRNAMPAGRHLVIAGDGSYTNRTVMRGLPADCSYIGRARKDCDLHYLPATAAGTNGRPRSYGEPAPTPESLRQDDSVPWQTVKAFAAGKQHDFRIKTLGPVLWKKSGADMPLRLVVIAPLGYRLKQGGRVLYRQPAYLLCTDPGLPLEELLQYYLWRWGIEVNFREEKTLIGTGDAHVRTSASNRHLPAVTVAAYALLWTTALDTMVDGEQLSTLEPPKWRGTSDRAGGVPSTGELLRQLRYESWSGFLRPGTLRHFASRTATNASASKPGPDLPATLFAAA